VPTIDVLSGLREEVFEAFKVAQGASGVEGKTSCRCELLRLAV
jgi:hypothetical protein